VDAFLAGLVGLGAVSWLSYAQTISVLPVSLFGTAAAAAALPEMSSVVGSPQEIAERLKRQLEAGLRRIAFFVIPSAVAFVAIGDQLIQLLYRSGRFGADEARWVWIVLAASAVGLLAATLGRLYSSAFYALHDAGTPLRFAVLRMTLSTVLGATLALLGPRLLGVDPRWGVAGIPLASGSAAWLEFSLLRRALARRIGAAGIPRRELVLLWMAALTAGGVGLAASWANRQGPAIIRALLAIALFGMVYWVITWRGGIPTAVQLRDQIFRRRTRRRE
jgi:putative peptidoglycan lipid II flippase